MKNSSPDRNQPQGDKTPYYAADYEITLNPDDRQYLTHRLTQMGDELMLFSAPSTRYQHAKAVPVRSLEPTILAPKDTVLHFQNTTDGTGIYSAELAIPGRTLVNEGTELDGAQQFQPWQSRESKDKPATQVDNARLIGGLAMILQNQQIPGINTLLDRPMITNREAIDTLWTDLKPLAPTWQETYRFNTTGFLSTNLDSSEDLYIRGQRINSEHNSAIEDSVSVTTTSTVQSYHLQTRTDIPFSVDIVNREDDNDSINYIDPFARRDGTVDIYKKLQFTVEKDLRSGAVATIARLALESTSLTAKNLEELAFRGSLEYHGDTQLVATLDTSLESVATNHLPWTNLK